MSQDRINFIKLNHVLIRISKFAQNQVQWLEDSTAPGVRLLTKGIKNSQLADSDDNDDGDRDYHYDTTVLPSTGFPS